jgi:catechol 2,3-dioxygenase-like lactoylglutathione lyase family enzyme
LRRNQPSEQKYFLPAIQREFVWKPEQIIELFDSIMRGYPISSFLFWQLKPETRGQLACDATAMVRIGSVVMNALDIRRAAEFWEKALGYIAQPDNPAFLVPQSGEGPRLHLDEDDRMHLDLWAADEEEQLAEVERLISLGARRVDWVYPDGADFVVLADTEGNLFCVINAGH